MSKQLDWTTGTACPDEASETYWMQTPMMHQADTELFGCTFVASAFDLRSIKWHLFVSGFGMPARSEKLDRTLISRACIFFGLVG